MAKDKDKFLRENYGVEGDVMIHEAAKKHFDKYLSEHGKPLPQMKIIGDELILLKTLKKQQYTEYQIAKAEYNTMLKLAVNLQSKLGKDAVRAPEKDFSV
jgi:hypothetical protein